NPRGERVLEDRVEERAPPGDAAGADQIAHLRRSFLRRGFGVPHKGPARRRGRDRCLIESDPQGATSARSSRRSRSGSASTTIATILPPLTVKAKTANGLPSGAQATPPGIPFTRMRVAEAAQRRKVS